MPNFIEFRTNYLIDNPGSNMIEIRKEYYKSIGKPVPFLKKQSKKKSRKQSKKTNQTGGEKINSLYNISNSIRDKMQSRIPDIYGIPDNSKRKELVKISNLIQDLSLNINNSHKINEDTQIDNYKLIIDNLNQKLNFDLNKIKDLSDNIEKQVNTNINLVSNMNLDDIESIKKTKNELQKTINNSKELYDLTNNMGNILKIINN